MVQSAIYKAPNMNKHVYITRISLFFFIFLFFSTSISNKLLAQQVSITGFVTHSGQGEISKNILNVPAGALLVLSTTNQYGGANLNAAVSSVPALTWNKRVDAGVTGGAEIYTAVFTAGGNITVKSYWGDDHYQSFVCYVVTNQEEVLGGEFATQEQVSQPLVNLTTTRNNSLIFCATSDWEATTGTITYRGNPTQALTVNVPLEATFYHYYYSAPTSGAYTLGMTTPNMNFGATTAALEIRSKADHLPPLPFTIGTSAIGPTTIDLSWAAVTDNVGVTGYDVYVEGVLHGSTSATTYAVTGLTQLTQYSIYIVAKDAAGNSTSSDPISVTTSGTVWSLTGNAGTNASTNFIGTTDEQGFAIRTGDVNRMFISSDGNVGIGTTQVAGGEFKLYVQTGIRTHRVKVDQANWPDYVFDKKYKLPSLKEIEAFIVSNKHLPGIPPASEIESEGLDLGDQQARLLKTIEELTLHMIRLSKQVERLTEENEILKGKVESISNN